MTNTYIKPFVCILLAILLLTGCAEKSEIPIVELKASRMPVPTSAPVSNVEPVPTPTRTPIPFVESTPFIPWTEKVDKKMQLTEKRELTLRCNVRYAEHSIEGVNQIEVLDGETSVQTLKINEAVNRAYDVEHHDENYYGLPDFEIMDINFDGFNDFGMFLDAGNVNENWLYWIWNPEIERFQYSCLLHGHTIKLDEERERIVCMSRDGSCRDEIHEFAWLKEDVPTCVYRLEEECYNDFCQIYYHHYEWMGGELKEIKCVVSEEYPHRLCTNGYLPSVLEVMVERRNGEKCILRLYGYSGYTQIDVVNEDYILMDQWEIPSGELEGITYVADNNGDGSEDLCTVNPKLISCGGSCAEHWLIWNPEKEKFIRGEDDPTVVHSYG